MTWDKRMWRGELVNTGVHSISCKFISVSNNFSWFLSGVQAPIRSKLHKGVGASFYKMGL